MFKPHHPGSDVALLKATIRTRGILLQIHVCLTPVSHKDPMSLWCGLRRMEKDKMPRLLAHSHFAWYGGLFPLCELPLELFLASKCDKVYSLPFLLRTPE